MSILYKPLRLRAGKNNIRVSAEPAKPAPKKTRPPEGPRPREKKTKKPQPSPHLTLVKKRQDALKKKGLCICCGKRKANVKRGSTKLRCAVCSEAARVYGKLRYAKQKEESAR